MPAGVPAKYIWAGVFSNLLYGFYIVPAKVLQSTHYSTHEILLGRISCATALLFLYVFAIKRKLVLMDIGIFFTLFSRKQRLLFLLFLVLSGVALCGNWEMYLYAIDTLGVKGGTLQYLTTPLITALFGFFILREKANVYKIVGLVIASGAIFIVGHDNLHNLLPVLAGSVTFGLYIVFQKFLPKISRISIFSVQLLISLGMETYLSRNQFATVGLPMHLFFWADCAILGSLFTILPIVLNLYSLVHLPVSTLAVLMYIPPITSFLIGVILFNDHLVTNEIVAYAILLVSAILFNFSLLQKAIMRRLSRHRVSKQHTST